MDNRGDYSSLPTIGQVFTLAPYLQRCTITLMDGDTTTPAQDSGGQVYQPNQVIVPGSPPVASPEAPQPPAPLISDSEPPMPAAPFVPAQAMKRHFPDEHIVAIDSVTHPKPHPEAFELAAAALDLSEEELARGRIFAFEDDPRGIMSAKAARYRKNGKDYPLFVCAITTRYTRAQLEALEVPPDLIADSFNEFARLLGLRDQR